MVKWEQETPQIESLRALEVQVLSRPPAFAICAPGGEGCRAEARECEGGFFCLLGFGLAGNFVAGSSNQ